MSGVWKTKPSRVIDVDIEPSANTQRPEHGDTPKPRQEAQERPRAVVVVQEQKTSTASPGRSSGRRGASDMHDLRKINASQKYVQFSTRITEFLNDDIRDYCIRRKQKLKITQRYGLGEFLEDAIESLKRDEAS